MISRQVKTRLGVNVDHVATVRQARKENFPSPYEMACIAVKAGANGITAHLREDRRHIQESDILELRKKLHVPLNMEMAATKEMVQWAIKMKPQWVCFVPERREEVTTEGGLQLENKYGVLKRWIPELKSRDIQVSLFIDPQLDAVRKAAELKANAVELHTGRYARLFSRKLNYKKELLKIKEAALWADRLGLWVNAGHGLDYKNIKALSNIFPFREFNIGFAIVARALNVGMYKAVSDMKEAM